MIHIPPDGVAYIMQGLMRKPVHRLDHRVAMYTRATTLPWKRRNDICGLVWTPVVHSKVVELFPGTWPAILNPPFVISLCVIEYYLRNKLKKNKIAAFLLIKAIYPSTFLTNPVFPANPPPENASEKYTPFRNLLLFSSYHANDR